VRVYVAFIGFLVVSERFGRCIVDNVSSPLLSTAVLLPVSGVKRTALLTTTRWNNGKASVAWNFIFHPFSVTEFNQFQTSGEWRKTNVVTYSFTDFLPRRKIKSLVIVTFWSLIPKRRFFTQPRKINISISISRSASHWTAFSLNFKFESNRFWNSKTSLLVRRR